MKATFISREKNDVKFTIEFTAEEFENAQIKAFQQNKDKFQIDGFRKGKAPRTIIERHYGEGVFFEDAIDELFRENYGKALAELELEVIDSPRAEFGKIAKGEGFTATITVACYPIVDVKDYKGVEIEKVTEEVKDEDVDKEIEALRKRNARMVAVERPAKEGDTLLLDYSGFVGDEQFEGGTAERQELKLGSGMFIPGFEEQLEGVAPGEKKDVTVTFPEDYHAENLAGKEAVFHCLVHEVKEEQLPEADDEFAKDVSEFDTLEEYKADIAKKLKEQNDRRAQNEYENALMDKICEEAQADIPDSMVERQIDYHLRDMEMRMSYQGLKMSDYLAYTGMTVAQLREMYRGDALKTVKQQLVLEAIKKAENIEADQEGIDKEIARYAEMFKKDAEEYKKEIKPDELEYIKETVTVNNIIEFIKQNNKPAAKRAPAKKKAAEGENDAAGETSAEAAQEQTAEESEAKPAKPARKPRQKKAAEDETPAE